MKIKYVKQRFLDRGKILQEKKNLRYTFLKISLEKDKCWNTSLNEKQKFGYLKKQPFNAKCFSFLNQTTFLFYYQYYLFFIKTFSLLLQRKFLEKNLFYKNVTNKNSAILLFTWIDTTKLNKKK